MKTTVSKELETVFNVTSRIEFHKWNVVYSTGNQNFVCLEPRPDSEAGSPDSSRHKPHSLLDKVNINSLICKSIETCIMV